DLLLVEVAQAIHHGGGGAAGELVVGATADGWDLVAYAAGIGFGWAVEAISRAADDGARRRRR
ncbi:MAG: hypothetical protein KC464_19305, partial [Myxococcales bacterium]|nr:hypothetical protein [Myxococcales bacterium]